MKDLNYSEAQRASIRAACFYVIDKLLGKSDDVSLMDLAHLNIDSQLGVYNAIRTVNDKRVLEACRMTANAKVGEFDYIRNKSSDLIQWEYKVVDRRNAYYGRRKLHIAINTDDGLGANRGLK